MLYLPPAVRDVVVDWLALRARDDLDALLAPPQDEALPFAPRLCPQALARAAHRAHQLAPLPADLVAQLRHWLRFAAWIDDDDDDLASRQHVRALLDECPTSRPATA